jgi:hypothetical protein
MLRERTKIQTSRGNQSRSGLFWETICGPAPAQSLPARSCCFFCVGGSGKNLRFGKRLLHGSHDCLVEIHVVHQIIKHGAEGAKPIVKQSGRHHDYQEENDRRKDGDLGYFGPLMAKHVDPPNGRWGPERKAAGIVCLVRQNCPENVPPATTRCESHRSHLLRPFQPPTISSGEPL